MTMKGELGEFDYELVYWDEEGRFSVATDGGKIKPLKRLVCIFKRFTLAFQTFYNMGFCKACNKWIVQPEGRRTKEFCNNTCRSNYWYGKNKKGKPIQSLPSPKVFDAPKLENYTQDEPLSFDKLKQQVIPKQYQPISLPVLMSQYFEAKRECQNTHEWKELSDRIDADERLNKQAKIILKTTI